MALLLVFAFYMIALVINNHTSCSIFIIQCVLIKCYLLSTTSIIFSVNTGVGSGIESGGMITHLMRLSWRAIVTNGAFRANSKDSEESHLLVFLCTVLVIKAMSLFVSVGDRRVVKFPVTSV